MVNIPIPFNNNLNYILSHEGTPYPIKSWLLFYWGYFTSVTHLFPGTSCHRPSHPTWSRFHCTPLMWNGPWYIGQARNSEIVAMGLCTPKLSYFKLKTIFQQKAAGRHSKKSTKQIKHIKQKIPKSPVSPHLFGSTAGFLKRKFIHPLPDEPPILKSEVPQAKVEKPRVFSANGISSVGYYTRENVWKNPLGSHREKWYIYIPTFMILI